MSNSAINTQNTTIGLVGCGKWGKYILRDLVSLGCQVHTVARSKSSIKNAIEGGSSTIVSSISGLPDIKGVVIATPTITHYEIINELVNRSIPIFVEKPLTNDLNELALLQPYAERLFVMDKWRYHRGVQKLKQIKEDGLIGEITSIQSYRWGWISKKRSINSVWYLAPHDLAIALEILGYIPEIKHAQLEIIDNKIRGCLATFGESPWLEIHVSEIKESHKRSVRLHGTKGIAILNDSYSKQIELYKFSNEEVAVKPKHIELPIDLEMPLFLELEKFIHYINGGEKPKSSFEDATKIIYAIEAIHQKAVQTV